MFVMEFKSQDWVEDDNVYSYNKREHEHQDLYDILADCGVPFINGEPVGIWSD